MDDDWIDVVCIVVPIILVLMGIMYAAQLASEVLAWGKFAEDHHCVSVHEEWTGSKTLHVYRCDNGQEIKR